MEQEDTIPHHLSMVDLFKLSLRSFSAKPARTILTILGTSVGIATVVVLVSLGYGLQGILLGKLVTTPQSLVTCDAAYPSDSNLVISSTTIATTAALPNVQQISPEAQFPGAVQIPGGSSGLVLVDIADQNYFPLSGNLPDIGDGFGSAGGVVISSQALRLLNLPATAATIGKDVSVTVFYPSSTGDTSFNVSSKNVIPITGIVVDNSETPTVIISKDSLPVLPPYYAQLYIEAKDDTTLTTLRSTLVSQGFLISAHIDLVRQAKQVTNIITLILGIFGIAALLVSAIGMFNTMIVGFLERTYEVGVMKALGATDGDVKRLFLSESLVMGVAGGAVGITLGVGIGWLLNALVSLFAEHYGGTAFELFVSPLWFLLVVIFVSAVIGLAAGLIPARRASFLSPKEAFIRK